MKLINESDTRRQIISSGILMNYLTKAKWLLGTGKLKKKRDLDKMILAFIYEIKNS